MKGRFDRGSGGWTLVELVVTVTVLAILTLGIVPLVKTSVKRHREQQLREALREVREAIREFRRDTFGIQCAAGGLNTGLGTGAGVGVGPPPGPGVPGAGAGPPMLPDPRSKVVISDCTIFSIENPDHYPPDLETMVNGVNVVPRATLGGLAPGINPGQQATDNKLLSTRKKVYLRSIPTDPMTGQADWDMRSCYDPPDSSGWGGENVFDVRSKSTATALDGSKYNEW
ncbi:MAG TPA: hypothetical protein VGV38_20470 [Pyrinomonadaceae bacterium]|nr:hypothetical protein [Pyrinomonadaceae bacterium]